MSRVWATASERVICVACKIPSGLTYGMDGLGVRVEVRVIAPFGRTGRGCHCSVSHPLLVVAPAIRPRIRRDTRTTAPRDAPRPPTRAPWHRNKLTRYHLNSPLARKEIRLPSPWPPSPLLFFALNEVPPGLGGSPRHRVSFNGIATGGGPQIPSHLSHPGDGTARLARDWRVLGFTVARMRVLGCTGMCLGGLGTTRGYHFVRAKL